MRDRGPAAAAQTCSPGAAGAARVCFLYIAQPHQLYHSLSAAVELARRRPDIAVDVVATKRETLQFAQALAGCLGSAPIGWRLLGPAWLRSIETNEAVPPKLPMLAANARLLNGYDVIVAPERTTAALRRLGVRRPRLVYTQHGAGDRGGPFEPRLAKFDLVFAAGPKQCDRMVGEGLVSPERCAVVGYPKFDLVDRLDPPLPRLFEAERPIVLYNPHFHRRLGSWFAWGPAILEAFARQSRYNLIFAPHIRVFAGRPARQIKALAPFVGHPAIHIETGESTAAIDMTYTRMADVYLGDVSSQVYEFLRRPRPCVFLDPTHARWQDDESFRHWRFGPVVGDVAGVLPAIDEARDTHGVFAPEQQAGFSHTFDLSPVPASRRAADAIARLVPAKSRREEDAAAEAAPPPRPAAAAARVGLAR